MNFKKLPSIKISGIVFLTIMMMSTSILVGCGGGGGGGTVVPMKVVSMDTMQFRCYVDSDPIPGYTKTVEVSDRDGNPMYDENGDPVINEVTQATIEIKVGSPFRLDRFNNREDYLHTVNVMKTMSVELGLFSVSETSITTAMDPNELLAMTHEVGPEDKLMGMLWDGWSLNSKQRFIASVHDPIPPTHNDYIDWLNATEMDLDLQFMQIMSDTGSVVLKNSITLNQIRLEGLQLN